MGNVAVLVRILRVVSLTEATSFLLLLVATAVKYGAGHEQGVQVLGPLHGVLFLAYCVLVVLVCGPLRWDVRTTLLALLASVVPFAPFVVERRLARLPGAAPASRR